MIERIKQLTAAFNLTASTFADRIDVSRPVVSHIFSGRNNPSLEVIQKIGMAFPAVSLDWLIFGKGTMLKDLVPDKNRESSHTPAFNSSEPQPAKDDNRQDHDKIQYASGQDKERKTGHSEDRKIVKVVLFYSDQTFESFDGPG